MPLPATWEREGNAMRTAIAWEFAALSARPINVVMTLDSRLPQEPGPWIVKRIAPGEHERMLPELSRAADFTVLIAPETSGVLARLTRDLEQAGACLLGSPALAVDLAGDKVRLAAQLRSLLIDTPRAQAIVPREGLPSPGNYPAVLKPVDGTGSVDTFYLNGPDDLPEAALRMAQAIFQPYVPGEPMSVSYLVSSGGQAWPIGVGRQRMAMHNGRFEYRGGEIPAYCPGAERQLMPAIAAVEGLRGFVGIDFIWDAERGHATLLEINPRPTTSIVGLCRLLPPGRLASAWLAAFHAVPNDNQALQSLFGLVHSQKPVVFSAAGKFTDPGEP